MRPLLLISAVTALALSAVASLAAPTVAPPPVFVLTGGGWGHGVGMSQWGAYGQARAGRTHDEILDTYYAGTTLAQAPARTVRVLVAAAAKRLTLDSVAGLRVRDAVGTEVELPPGPTSLDPALVLTGEDGPTTLASPLTITSVDGRPVALEGTAYRGRLTLSSDGRRLQAINVVGLEPYLQGVVPGEMPRGWPLEALKAQAVAARTYAHASLVKGKPFDLYADWRSQVYYGVDEESAATTRAVRETRGQILTFEGRPAQALYFSSSGGRTRNAADVYGQDVPYLVTVDDPWDAVESNPNHRWEPIAVTGAKLGATLKLGSRVVRVVTTLGADGFPVTVSFTTVVGVTTTLRARDVRVQLGLRSTSFKLGVLQLSEPGPPAATGWVRLDGVARDVEAPALERLAPDGTWAVARKLVPRPDGSFRLAVRPSVTTTYRLTGAGVPGPAVTVVVDGAPA